MTYAGIQMFMEKLNQLIINCNDIPIANNPTILRERLQFQLLHQQLGSMIQSIFIDEHQDLQKGIDLKKRFTAAAEEAEYIVDLFLSSVHIRNTTEDFPTVTVVRRDDVRRSFKSAVNQFLSCFHISNTTEDFPTSDSEGFTPSLNLDGVRRSLKSVEVEFMSMNIDSKKLNLSPRPLNQSAAATRNSLPSNKVLKEISVGIDRDAELIRDKLVEDQKKLDVVSIVGMGGIGKTTLATKVFTDGYVKHHFYVRVWVTISQTYDIHGVLTQILESIRGQVRIEKVEKEDELIRDNMDKQWRLREMVHKLLMGRRYLIVIDDIWDTEAWDSLKVFFPHDNNGSRILLTSRLIEVAKHAHKDGLIHHLGYLNKESSWELLCQKVFHGNECPEWTIKPGMQIVENCQGLPLAVVVIAGILSKYAWSKEFWVEIAEKTGSYIINDQSGCMETLALSYNHLPLPLHLRECFLYLGGFPEDYEFKVEELIWLWVAEGFIQQDGDRSFEDIAEGYLMNLIDRNLVSVARRSSSNEVVKACKVHDLVRELCLRKAKEELFIIVTERLILSPQISNVITQPYKPVRTFTDRICFFINGDRYDPDFVHSSAQNLRSITCFNHKSGDITKCLRSFVLLRVLDLQKCALYNLPKGIEMLVHLRYLAIWISSQGFPSSICNLWSLQSLIYVTGIGEAGRVVLPSNISDLVNLKHLTSYHLYRRKTWRFFLPSIDKPLNLQTISDVEVGDAIDDLQKCFPCIKKLTCRTNVVDFKSLPCLEKLNLIGSDDIYRKRSMDFKTFPATLKSLTLSACVLQSSDMSIFQSLPNLQVLKLAHDAFEGSCWNTHGQEFPKLKCLKLEWLSIKKWKAYSASFPCLKRLQITCCTTLNVPLEIGDIPTLELIQIKGCYRSVGESVRRIEEEQHDLGNYDIKIDIILEDRFWL